MRMGVGFQLVIYALALEYLGPVITVGVKLKIKEPLKKSRIKKISSLSRKLTLIEAITKALWVFTCVSYTWESG